MAQCLTTRGWRVDLFDAASGPAQAASALPVGMLSPHVTRAPTPLSRLSALGVAHTLSELKRLVPEGQGWQACEVDNWAHDPGRWPAALVRPSALVQAWLAEAQATGRLTTHWHTTVAALVTQHGGWQLLNTQGVCVAQAPTVVIAAALGSATLLKTLDPPHDWRAWPLHPVKGQMSWGIPQGPMLAPRPQRNNGVFVPRYDDAAMPAPWPTRLWSMGSTYDRGVNNTTLSDDAHARNAQSLHSILPQAPGPHDASSDLGPWHGWAEVRCASLDRLPLVGAVPDIAALQQRLSDSPHTRSRMGLRDVPRQAELYTLSALGSRGLTLAHWCAHALSLQMDDQPTEAPADLLATIDPARFVWKQSRRQAPSMLVHSKNE